MAHSIKLEQFEGPLALLLQLVERDEMEITEVSLTEVTESYLNYLNQSAVIPEEEMADFLVVAAKLLYMKSKSLLPELVAEQEDGISLEDQLKMYKEFVEATKKVEAMIKKKKFSYFREQPLKLMEQGFYPPKGVTGEKMKHIFEEVLERLRPIIELPRVSLEKTITIKDKIAHIQRLLSESARVGFHHLLQDVKSRTEIIVSFLALLELSKQREIVIVQENNFEEIVIERV